MAKRKKLRRYPWDKWFSCKQTRLLPRRDYDCMPHCMAVQIRDAAAQRGRRVSVETDPKGQLTITVLKRKRKRK